MRRAGGRTLPQAALACLLAQGCASPAALPAEPGFARGIVYHDRDADGRRDRFEWGLAGVAVSNGRDVTWTDWRGRYRVPVGDDTIVFVVQPRGYRAPTDEHGIPRFYYVHKPAGSPTHLRFAGVPPTGDLPDRIDFGLLGSDPGNRFRALLFGDTQPASVEELELLARDVVEPLIGADAAFGMTLGDLVADDLSLFLPLARTVGRIGIPWYAVIGNHDLNYLARDDATSDETYERVFGPTRYAFQVGRVHFVVLDDVHYPGWDAQRDEPGSYRAVFDDDTLAFVANYLAGVPERDLIVLAMHIPLVGPEARLTANAERLLELLSGHPHTLSFSAHAHRQFQRHLGAKDGYRGTSGVHHHVNVGAVSGSWWRGAPDEDGIPHTTMRDGAPNGHFVVDFDGIDYRMQFHPARRPPAHQMNVIAPFQLRAADAAHTEIVVNVFAASERSRVELRLGDGAWQPMKRVTRRDPLYEAAVARESGISTRPPLPGAVSHDHMWIANLPPDPPTGTHVLEIRATDAFDQTHTGRRILHIE